MNPRGALNKIYSDYRRYRASGEKGLIQVVLLSQGFWASCVYRLAHRIYTDFKIPVIRPILRIVFVIAQKIVEIVTGICLPAKCHIGEGLYIGHFGPVIVHSDVRIGDNCNLSQGVTLGLMQRGKWQGAPLLGNRVFVGPNAVIVGAISIGDDAAIGAGAVVTRSIPPMAVVVGSPAEIVSYQGSFEFVQVDGMDDDPERLAALNRRETIGKQGK
jgi:serine O-acetyltransferase